MKLLDNIKSKFSRETGNRTYLPEIDGLRFLSITLITLFHIHGYFIQKTHIAFSGNLNDYFYLDKFLSSTERRVPLFFAVSGFIVCLPFAQQYIKGGKKMLIGEFYLRRIARLQVPYVIVLTGLALLQLAMHVHTIRELVPSYFASLFYSHILLLHKSPLISIVIWTMEIEIQFYLVAPFLFKVLQLNEVPRRLILILGIVAFAAYQYYYPTHKNYKNLTTFLQYFLAGILLADVYVSGIGTKLFKNKLIAIITPLLFFCLFFVPIRASILLFALFPFGIITFYYIILRNPVIKGIFSYKYIPVIGGMSYSIYLLHYPVVSMLGRFTLKIQVTHNYAVNLLFQSAVLVAATLIISAVFFVYLEKPFMSPAWVYKLIGRKMPEPNKNNIPKQAQCNS